MASLGSWFTLRAGSRCRASGTTQQLLDRLVSRGYTAYLSGPSPSGLASQRSALKTASPSPEASLALRVVSLAAPTRAGPTFNGLGTWFSFKIAPIDLARRVCLDASPKNAHNENRKNGALVMFLADGG